MKEINLVTVADENIKLGLMVVLYSALKRIDPGFLLNIYVLEQNLKDTTKIKIKKSLLKLNKNHSLHFIQIPNGSLNKLKNGSLLSIRASHNNNCAYARLLISDLLPQETKHCIYLDCDMYVNKDLADLSIYCENLQYPVYAVEDLDSPKIRVQELIDEYTKRNLNPCNPYFNSGMLLINLDLWRKEAISKQGINLSLEIQEINPIFDQPVLNILFYNNWGKLDSSWNECEISLEGSNQNKSAIIHYIGPNKPWRCIYSYEKFKLFYDILEETEWKGWKPPFDFGKRYLRSKLGIVKWKIKHLCKI